MSTRIRIGMLRLTDSAPVAVAKARNLFKPLAIDAVLSIEPSWANIADKLSYGLLDAAVMLPPLALSLAIGLRGPPAKLIVPMGLSQGGNTIVLRGEAPRDAAGLPPGARLLTWLRGQPRTPRIAVVHWYSTHNLLLRYWLALTGVDPDTAIETVVVPPEQVVAALASGQIDGFCAGAPWGVTAQMSGIGNVLLGTSDIWPFHPEKCLAVRADWACENPDALTRVLRALMRAQALCDQPEEADWIADVLGDPNGLALPRAAARAALPGGNPDAPTREHITFHVAGAAHPAPPHGLWFLRQMRRWGWVDNDLDLSAAVASVYRPDLYALAARMEDLFPLPGSAHSNATFEAVHPPNASDSAAAKFE